MWSSQPVSFFFSTFALKPSKETLLIQEHPPPPPPQHHRRHQYRYHPSCKVSNVNISVYCLHVQYTVYRLCSVQSTLYTLLCADIWSVPAPFSLICLTIKEIWQRWRVQSGAVAKKQSGLVYCTLVYSNGVHLSKWCSVLECTAVECTFQSGAQ